MTNNSRQSIKKTIKHLLENKILIKIKESSYDTPRVLSLNRNYKQWWDINTPQGNKLTPEHDEYPSSGIQTYPSSGVQKYPHKRKHKENYKEINKSQKTAKKDYSTDERFLEFCGLYPRVQGKEQTYKNYLKQLQEYTHEEIIESVNNYLKTIKGQEKQFLYISYNFLGSKAYFKDFLDGVFDESKLAKEIKIVKQEGGYFQ